MDAGPIRRSHTPSLTGLLKEAKRVERLFGKAWPAQKFPEHARVHVAQAIDTVRLFDTVKGSPRFHNTVAKSARKFLNELSRARARAAVTSNIGERCIRDVIEAYDLLRNRNAARYIADAVRFIWPSGDPPGYTNEQLTLFVTKALAGLGHHYSETYVRDMLRNRHHRRR